MLLISYKTYISTKNILHFHIVKCKIYTESNEPSQLSPALFRWAPQRITTPSVVVGNSLFQSWIKTIFSSLFYLFLIQPIVLKNIHSRGGSYMKKVKYIGPFSLHSSERRTSGEASLDEETNLESKDHGREITETMMKWKCLLLRMVSEKKICWEIKSKLKTREDLVLEEIELLIKSFSFILFYQLYPFFLLSCPVY